MNANDPADILARTIWGEARGEDAAATPAHDGMAAVAAVVMNRARRPRWWGGNVLEVCRKPFQFSCWNANDPNRAKLETVSVADPQFREALAIARLALSNWLVDMTGGADHYHATGVFPRWARGQVPTAEIGTHLFYRLED